MYFNCHLPQYAVKLPYQGRQTNTEHSCQINRSIKYPLYTKSATYFDMTYIGLEIVNILHPPRLISTNINPWYFNYSIEDLENWNHLDTACLFTLYLICKHHRMPNVYSYVNSNCLSHIWSMLYSSSVCWGYL